VDLYNVISASTGISIGAHDVATLVGAPRLDILSRDTPFTVIGGNVRMTARKGEYCYLDDEGVLCRMDIKQCNRTKVSLTTATTLMFFQGHEQVTETQIEDAVGLFEQALCFLRSP
jgi:DNA/RNA-binding domain of Phe-tRNA-synthetase-like protein